MLCDVERFKKDPSTTFDYSYFVDNSPTKYVNNVVSSTPASAVSDDEYDEDEVKEKNNMIPILAGIAATLIIAIIVLGIIFIPRLFSSTGDEIACPKFIGQTLEKVKDNEEYNKNFVLKEEWDYDSEYEYGYIFKQDPSNGKKLKKGAEITLYVSMGKSTIKVPDVYGKTESYAVSELKSKGFVTEINEVADDDIEAGLVVKTEPARTTVVAEGTKITIFVSTGKKTKMVDVPNVVGLKEEKAVSDIKKAGLVPAVERRDLTSKDKFYDAGYVITQSPDANSSSQVAQGTIVTIYVSTGVTNYSFDLRIDLPSDFKASTGTVSIWQDGKLIKESETLSFSDVSSYTFKGLTSTDKTMTALVKIKAKDGDYIKYRDIEIDCSTGKYDTIKRYEDYKKYSDGGSFERSQNN